MAGTRGQSGVGGAAGEIGSIFRAKVAAWIVSHALLGRRVEPLEMDSPEHEVPTGELLFEGSTDVDDIEAWTQKGGRFWVQAKSTLKLEKKADSEYAKAVRQFAAQASRHDFDPTTTRLVLAVGKASGSLRDLQSALSRNRKPLASEPNKAQQSALDLFRKHASLSTDQAQRLERATVVLLLDLDTPEKPDQNQWIAYLNTITSDPQNAWAHIESKARTLAAARLGANLDVWLRTLQIGGISVTATAMLPSATALRTLEALSEYRNNVIQRGRRLTLRALQDSIPNLEVVPNTHAISVEDDHGCAELHWAVRRKRRILLRGLPGIGKSTALRRLAAEASADPEGPLPLLVHLPDLANDRTRSPAEESIVRHSLTSLPSDMRSLLFSEALFHVTKTGKVVLLLDSLDECNENIPAALDTIFELLDVLHADAELVLATRDSAYAGARGLGLHEVELHPPLDMNRIVRQVARHLVELYPNDKTANLDPDKIADSLQPRRGWKTDCFDHTPLAMIGKAILVIRENLSEGFGQWDDAATGNMELVKFIASRWEMCKGGQKQQASGMLTSGDTELFLIQSFSAIAFFLDRATPKRKEHLLNDVTKWAMTEWSLPRPQARAASNFALEFWDQAGVYVSTESPAMVRPRQYNLYEIGLAQWIADHASEEERTAWLERYAHDGSHDEIIMVAAALSGTFLKAVVNLAIGLRDYRLADLALKAFLRRRDREDVSHLNDVVLAVGPHMIEDSLPRRKMLAWVVRLPLRGVAAASLYSMISNADDSHARMAALVAQIAWNIKMPDGGELITAVDAGPPVFVESQISGLPARNFDLYRIFTAVVAESSEILEENPSLISSLVWNRWISDDARAELKQVLAKSGQKELLEQVEQNMPSGARWELSMTRISPTDVRKKREAMNRQWDHLLASIESMEDGSASYRQLREMSEIVDLMEVVVPAKLPVDTMPIHELLGRQDAGRTTLRTICVLSGLDIKVVSAQAGHLRAFIRAWDGLPDFWYAARAPLLDKWPRDSSDAQDLIETLVRMAGGDTVSCYVARLGFETCPHVALAISMLEESLLKSNEWKSKFNLAWSILSTEARPLVRSRRWMRGADVVLARCAAFFAAYAYLEGKADVVDVKEALLIGDSKIRLNVRRILGRRHSSEALHEIAEYIGRSESEIVGWTCMGCGAANDSHSAKCGNCSEDI
jgi:hypothetical protein